MNQNPQSEWIDGFLPFPKVIAKINIAFQRTVIGGNQSGQICVRVFQPFQNRKRYYGSYTGENTFVLSYPEMCFNIAEAESFNTVRKPFKVSGKLFKVSG